MTTPRRHLPLTSFTTSLLGGYDKGEVDAYVQVAEGLVHDPPLQRGTSVESSTVAYALPQSRSRDRTIGHRT